MKCQQCQYISQDVSPKFCSQCGTRFATEAVRDSINVEPTFVPGIQVDGGGEDEEQGMVLPGELRVVTPHSPKAVKDELLPHSTEIGPFQLKDGTSLPVSSVCGNPNIVAPKKKKKKKKRKNKNLASEETMSLTSVTPETSVQELTKVNSEQGDPLTSLESEADSLLHAALESITLVEKSDLFTSSSTVIHKLVESTQVKRALEEEAGESFYGQVAQSAAPLTEFSADVHGSNAWDLCNVPVQEEGKMTSFSVSVVNIEQCRNTDEGVALQLGENKATSRLVQIDGHAEKSFQTLCVEQAFTNTALMQGHAVPSGDSSDKETQGALSIKKDKAEIQNEEEKICEAKPEKVEETQDVPLETKECQADPYRGKDPLENGKGDQVCSKNYKKDQVKSETFKGGQTMSEQGKGDQASSKMEGEIQVISKNEKDEQANLEETNKQANSEKKLTKKEKKKNQQKSTVDPEQPEARTEKPEGTPVKEPKNKNNEVYKRSLTIGDSVKVYFHAILSNDFKLDLKKHKVMIRAGGIPGYEPWKQNICEMHFFKNLDEHGMLFEGLLTVAKADMKNDIPYKYCVLRGGKCDYEFIYKPDVPEGTIVNRCLSIPENYLTAGEWHQYDDIVCVKPDQGLLKKLKSLVGFDSEKRKLLTGKEIAGEIMLNCIFNLLTTLDSTNLKNFLNQLHHFHLVYCNPMVHENGPRKWTSLHFGEMEVKALITNALCKVAEPFLSDMNTKATPGGLIVKNRQAAGLIVLIVGEIYKLSTSKEQLNNVCRLLCLQKMPRDEALAELERLRDVFSVLTYIKQCLMALCQRCIDEKVAMWVTVLPVFHFFSSFNPDQTSSMSLQIQQEDIWAGLEGFEFHTFRNNPSEKSVNRQIHIIQDIHFSA